MSLYAVEKVFWELGKYPERIARLQADPDGYLAAYNLDDEERRMIREVDLKGLSEKGVSTLLTLMVWPMFKGPEGLPYDYLEHMAGGAGSAPGETRA